MLNVTEAAENKSVEAKLPVVRLATYDDLPEVLEMTKRLHSENGLFSLNLDKVQDTIERCFTRKGTIVGVIGKPGALEASTCLELSNFYYSDDWHIAELWNFVDAPYRRSQPRNAEALVHYGMQWADNLKLPLFTGIITNKQMAGKVRLYRRLLGAPTGAFFLYNGNWKSEPISDNRGLCERLREGAQRCAQNRVTTRADLVELSQLLREASQALRASDNIWGGSPQPPATLNTIK